MRHVPLVISLVALGLAAAAYLRPPPTVEPAVCECNAPVDQAQTAALRAQLAGLETRLSEVEIADVVKPASPPKRPEPAPAPEKPAAPKRVRVDSPNPSVSVKVGPGGQFSLTNSDVSLTGQTMMLEATYDDGHTEQIPVTVPGPQ